MSDFVNTFYIEENKRLDSDTLDFLIHLVIRVKNVAEGTPTLQAPEDLLFYYPPKTGIAYYFTNSGAKMRNARKFPIDGKAMGKDDHLSTATCTKYYPKVARKDTTFMFLWFCHNHGHCFGFHINNRNESQKDSAYSLYKHLPGAPEILFSDFTCGLEEHCLNREAGYFKNTRFYHNIFHGCSHGCSLLYRYKDLIGFRGINTSICEQFNSFLQCVKSSSKHISQKHFMFFTQHVIQIWNCKNKVGFERKPSIAISEAN